MLKKSAVKAMMHKKKLYLIEHLLLFLATVFLTFPRSNSNLDACIRYVYTNVCEASLQLSVVEARYQPTL
jgi:hypothetical protein